jgi:serine/threonine protein kinase
MKPPADASACDPAKVVALLENQLAEHECAAVELHLDQCQRCRDFLDAQSAEAAEWNKAAEFLRDEAWELMPLTGSAATDAIPDAQANVLQQVMSRLAASDDPQMLGRIGGYEVLGAVGYGGMGVVLKGYDTALKRIVAIKVLSPLLATSESARTRFAREAQAAAAVTHDNIIQIYSVDQANGLPYLVMPFSRGTSLQKRLDQRGALELVEVLRIGFQIASGLAAFHAQGLVHRDIKPANILLSEHVERLMITDFGLARAVDDISVTKTGVIAGTPQFMSPEQALGLPVDARSDLFSLGSLMYALCTGNPPFCGESSYAILRQVIDVAPQPITEINPSIPAWLGQLVAKLLEKSPAARYPSAEQVAQLLQKCLAHVQDPSSAPLPLDELPRPPRWRPRHLRAAGIGALSVAITLGIWAAASNSRPEQDKSPLPPASHATSSSNGSSSPAAAARPALPADWQALDESESHLIAHRHLKAIILAVRSQCRTAGASTAERTRPAASLFLHQARLPGRGHLEPGAAGRGDDFVSHSDPPEHRLVGGLGRPGQRRRGAHGPAHVSGSRQPDVERRAGICGQSFCIRARLCRIR